MTVLSVNGNQVRVGIDAPRDVPVHREEVYDRISDEQKQKKSSDPSGSNGPS